MSREDQPGRENEELRDRLARLSAAILRISASLELDAVLHEVVDSARALTGARCGVIATVDETGQAQDFVSSGLSPQEHRQLAEWPDGRRLFEHLRNLPGALRLPDLNGYVRSLGFSSKPLPTQAFKTFQGTPMRHRAEPRDGPSSRQLVPCVVGGIAGEVQRPATCTSTRGMPASTSDWADPTLSEWPEIGPSIPARAHRCLMMSRIDTVFKAASPTLSPRCKRGEGVVPSTSAMVSSVPGAW